MCLPDTERGLIIAPIAPWIITDFLTNWVLAAYWAFAAPTPQWVLDQHTLDTSATVTPKERPKGGQVQVTAEVVEVKGAPGEDAEATVV